MIQVLWFIATIWAACCVCFEFYCLSTLTLNDFGFISLHLFFLVFQMAAFIYFIIQFCEGPVKERKPND